jgi:hypothetical protein
MDELVQNVATTTGIDPAIAWKSVIIILKFLNREGPPEKIGQLIDGLPGAREAINADNTQISNGGVMGVFGDLTAAGLGMFQVQDVARAFIAYARQKVGPTEVDAVVAAIPGLSQFV